MAGETQVLSGRFTEAFNLAATLHAGQRRKGTSIPYVSHLLAVTALVLEDGGTESEAIAALLHDSAEDQGGTETLAEIEARFGSEVATIVAGCSDTQEQPKPPWRARKKAYLDHLRVAELSVLRVALADKLHNARSLLADRRSHGPAVWSRFRAPATEQLWFLAAFTAILEERQPGAMATELRRTADELVREGE